MERVDWFRIIADINGRGVSVCQMSERTMIPRTTIQALKSGTEPRHCDGEKIIHLWRELMSHSTPKVQDFKQSRIL